MNRTWLHACYNSEVIEISQGILACHHRHYWQRANQLCSLTSHRAKSFGSAVCQTCFYRKLAHLMENRLWQLASLLATWTRLGARQSRKAAMSRASQASFGSHARLKHRCASPWFEVLPWHDFCRSLCLAPGVPKSNPSHQRLISSRPAKSKPVSKCAGRAP